MSHSYLRRSSLPTLKPALSLEPNPASAEAPDRRCTEPEILQHMLEVESSRHRLERYAQELSRLAEYSASATMEAKQLAQRKGDLVATLSHEMRTPLNGILGMAQHLESRSLDPEDRNCVELIRKAGESLLSLVDGVLHLAKVDAGKLELTSENFNLRQTVQDALSLMHHAADSKTLRLVPEIAGDVPACVKGDALRLRQILLNLLGNAIKFSQHGTITLRVETAPGRGSKQGLRFTVVDCGIGISPEGQARLFQRFSQADSSISLQYGGTGLGLAICKSLVELMGGSIGVVSKLGFGSSFWFTIQAEPAEVERPVPLVSQPEHHPLVTPVAVDTRILLVEDNLINQKVATLMLKKIGHTATIAENGLKAVEAAAERQYDLILMDCLMPEMDGLQATRLIRQGPNNGAQIPIIAMTANAFSQDREACFAAGMSDYLSKPVRDGELKQMIDRWLPCKQSAQSTRQAVDSEIMDAASA